jgi:hypothetical protein
VQDFERIDSGSLTLTNKRLVFDGSMESRVVDLNKIVSAEVAASDSIQITTNGRMKDSTFTVHNPILWSVLIQSMVKDPNCVYAMNKPDATPPSSNGAPTREQMQSWWIAKNGTDHCVLN